MALVTYGFTLQVELVDRGGDITTKTYDLTATTHADALTASAAIVGALDAVTNAKIRSYSVSEKYKDNAFTLPLLGQIEEQALIVLRLTSDPTKSATHTIPAPVDGIFMDTSGEGFNTVDGTDSLLQAYLDIFDATGESYISDGERSAGFVSGKRIHRKSRRG